jgi:ATP-dependent 26S proteasome regulatory subunit
MSIIKLKKVIVKASSGPRYVVGVRVKLDKAKLTVGTRVSLDVTTLTIMRILPREVDPVVFHMLNEGKFNILSENQIPAKYHLVTLEA